MTGDQIEPAQTTDPQPEVNQPGLGALREAVANYTAPWRRPGPGEDAIAGLSTAIANVPDGLANGVLVGVNPVYGLYATMVGPFTGGFFSSTQLMVITTTAAASLTAGQALAPFPVEARDGALFVMVALAGVFQFLLGLLRLGRLTRFVSYSVMTGFLAGVAVLLILGQIPIITGYEAVGNNRIMQTIDLVTHIRQADPWSVATGILALLLAAVLPRVGLGNAGGLVAIIVPSVLLAIFGMESVSVVRDVGTVPDEFPTPDLPSFAGALNVLTGALSVAVVILVQGAGVSQSVPNPDGSRSSASRDFIAQGAANVVSGLFRGLPVGGSVSTTALNVISGARTRRASIFAGLWMAAIVVIFPDLVAHVAMPALGALLVLAGIRSIKPASITSVWQAGWPSRLAGVTTFAAMLFLPIQAAVGIGVALSALLYMNEASTDVSVVELVRRPDGNIEERTPPAKLPGGKVTILDVYGHLFYAGARTLEVILPSPRGVRNPVVILRLRGRTAVHATLVEVLSSYADQLRASGGRLYLTGISEEVYSQLIRTRRLRLTGPVRLYGATPVVGESTRMAIADAEAWLVGIGASASPDEPASQDA